MSNSTTLKLKPEAVMPLAILSLTLSILALVLSLFSGISYIFLTVSLFISVPATILATLILLQESNGLRKGLSIASLICCNISWVIVSMIVTYKMYEVIINYFFSLNY